MTGTGKTHLAKKIIKNHKRVIIIDDRYEYNDGIIFYSLLDLLEYIGTNDNQFVYICRFDNIVDIEYLFKLTFEIGNLLLVIEECYQYIDVRARNSFFIDYLVNRGRHREISLLLILQRIPDLNVSVRAQINELYIFKQVNPYDIEKLKPYGIETNNLKSLGTGEYKYLTYN